MINRRAGLLLGCLSTFGVSQGQAAQMAPPAQIDLARDLGLFAAKPQGSSCLAIANPALKPGREIILIWVPVDGEPYKPEIRQGKIVGKLAALCDQVNQPAGDSSYRLEAGRLDSGRVYIAVAARPNNLRIAGSEVIARLGNLEITFRSCTSTEGLHFGAWSGNGTRERRVWRRYFYLGYDVEPTCMERDFEEAKP